MVMKLTDERESLREGL